MAIEHPACQRAASRVTQRRLARSAGAHVLWNSREVSRGGHGELITAAVYIVREVGEKALFARSVSRTQLFEREFRSGVPFATLFSSEFLCLRPQVWTV